MRRDGNSQTDEILRALRNGDRITPLEALGRFGCMRLAPRILELRRRGIRIERALVDRNGKRVAEYFLPRKKRAA